MSYSAIRKSDHNGVELEGVVLIKRPPVFEDHRGNFSQLFNYQEHRELGCPDFVKEDFSVSGKGVLRGLHGDDQTWKLVSCLQGGFYLVVLNHDETSPEFGTWQGFWLSDTNCLQVLIPPKFGTGHVVMTDQAIFHYKQSEYYDSSRQFTVAWNDPKFNIWWPIGEPILSEKDHRASY